MRILFVGDVVGRPGRFAVRKLLPGLRKRLEADFVIVNCENSAAGWGVTSRTAEELISAGADVLTGGNHIFANHEAPTLLDAHPQILRPANYAPGVPGRGAAVYKAANGVRVGVLNLLGRTFMDPAESPFRRADEELEGDLAEAPVVIVDFHAEATSEKQAMGYYLDGRVTGVFGTHTHVQTADEGLLPRGTAFITDAGMTGPVGTVIGVSRDIVLRRFTTGMPERFEVPKGGEAMLCGVVVEASLDKRAAISIERVTERVSE